MEFQKPEIGQEVEVDGRRFKLMEVGAYFTYDEIYDRLVSSAIGVGDSLNIPIVVDINQGMRLITFTRVK